jgi:regulator of sigma E protease
MQLLQRLGDTGTISFDVRYPQSSLVYTSQARIQDWLKDEAEPDMESALGLSYVMPVMEATVAEVIPGGAAEVAGMRVGDRILRVDGVAVRDWSDWVTVVRAHAGLEIAVDVARDGADVVLRMTPASVKQPDGSTIGQVGVAPVEPQWPKEYLRSKRYGPLEAWQPAVQQTWQLAAFTVEAAKKMLTGQISSKNLSGPITIAKVATASAHYGLESYIGFLALLSISLGVLNLFPIPVLDGGHLV